MPTKKELLRNPGPGSHDLPSFPDTAPLSNVLKAAAFTMGAAHRVTRAEGRANKQRGGPGAQNPRYNVVEKKHCGHGFGRSRRVLSEVPGRNRHCTPAPQAEQIDSSSYRNAPQFSFGSAAKDDPSGFTAVRRNPRGCKAPGPGEHNPDDTWTSKSVSAPMCSATPRREVLEVSLHSQSRARSLSARMPGPGSYGSGRLGGELSETSPPCYGFGTTARLPSSFKERRHPGPGQYDVSGSTRTGHATDHAPKWSMGIRGEIDLRTPGS